MRRFSCLWPFRALALMVLCEPAFAAGGAIDPDPRAPSLSELLQREEDARTRRSASTLSEALPVAEASVPGIAPPVVIPAPATPAKSVRQVYPSPYEQRAVTVLVPGGRQTPPSR